MQKGGGSISLWGCIASIDVDPLIFYEDRVNASSSVQLIGDVLLAFISSRFGTSTGGFWYMQDNTGPQVSGFAKNFYERNKIPILEWPPTCSDLNPIANLWT